MQRHVEVEVKVKVQVSMERKTGLEAQAIMRPEELRAELPDVLRLVLRETKRAADATGFRGIQDNSDVRMQRSEAPGAGYLADVRTLECR